MREDWELVKLGDFALHEKGIKPKNQQSNKDEVFKYPYVNIEAFEKGIIETYTDGVKCRFCDESDFLMVWDGSRSGLVGKGMRGVLGSTLVRLNFPGIENQYAFHYLSSKYQEINSRAKGSGTPHVDPFLLWNYNFPIAPLPEQRAIVAKIEALFSDLDKAEAELRKAQEQLKVYRQAVLKKTFEHIKEKTSLGNCGVWKGGGTPSRSVKEYWENGTIPWVSSRDVKTKEIHDTERHITEIAIPNSSTKWVEKESLLFVMRSGILRRIFPIAIAKTRLCVNQDIQTVSLNEKWNPEYLYWYLIGNESDIRNSCSKDGTTVESIDSIALKLYQVPCCSLEKQNQIVHEIETILSNCDSVEQKIIESLETAKALRQSILKKAFKGTLLSEAEIETCKKESDWEPASALLERIKMESKK